MHNWVGEVVRLDIGKEGNTSYHELPAKQGEEAGCLCLALDAGLWTVILKTFSHEGTFEVPIEAGRIMQFPVGYRDH